MFGSTVHNLPSHNTHPAEVAVQSNKLKFLVRSYDQLVVTFPERKVSLKLEEREKWRRCRNLEDEEEEDLPDHQVNITKMGRDEPSCLYLWYYYVWMLIISVLLLFFFLCTMNNQEG